ncbi:MAG: zf-HC2 domain-containing protein [Pyrinomonadaceae bacterium]
MKCLDVKENLNTFFDDEIESIQKRRIENHLKECVSCQAEVRNLQSVSRALKGNLQIFAPLFLDEKVMNAFQTFHDKKRVEKIETNKIGWFGIPRFAFAAASILFVLGMFSAFQIGKMSAGEISVVMPQVQENQNLPIIKSSENEAAQDEKNVPVKIVETLVIREKIVKVPIIKTRTITVEKENKTAQNMPAKDDLALKSSVVNNGYLTRTNLTNFQPVSELNLKINKEEKQNEK